MLCFAGMIWCSSCRGALTKLSLSCYSGKTTLLSVLAHGEPVETVPTIGLNVKVFKKGKVNMKCWDIGTSWCSVLLVHVSSLAIYCAGCVSGRYHIEQGWERGSIIEETRQYISDVNRR